MKVRVSLKVQPQMGAACSCHVQHMPWHVSQKNRGRLTKMVRRLSTVGYADDFAIEQLFAMYDVATGDLEFLSGSLPQTT